MKLFYTKGACSFVVRIILNELNLQSEFESVNLQSKKTESGEDFYKINPKGSVPALEVKSNEILTENVVILQYLADMQKATHLLPAIGDFKRYRVLEWLNYITTELHKGFGPLFNPSIPQQLKDEIFVPLLKQKFEYVNKHLQKTYIMGDEFTLPDAYLFVMLLWASKFQLPIESWANLSRFFSGLQQRDAIRKALKEEGLG